MRRSWGRKAGRPAPRADQERSTGCGGRLFVWFQHPAGRGADATVGRANHVWCETDFRRHSNALGSTGGVTIRARCGKQACRFGTGVRRGGTVRVSRPWRCCGIWPWSRAPHLGTHGSVGGPPRRCEWRSTCPPFAQRVTVFFGSTAEHRRDPSAGVVSNGSGSWRARRWHRSLLHRYPGNVGPGVPAGRRCFPMVPASPPMSEHGPNGLNVPCMERMMNK